MNPAKKSSPTVRKEATKKDIEMTGKKKRESEKRSYKKERKKLGLRPRRVNAGLDPGGRGKELVGNK